MYTVCIDTGGTFTDAVLFEGNRIVTYTKVPTSAEAHARSILDALARLAVHSHMDLSTFLTRCAMVVVGTTLATNTVIEEKGARCALFYTDGFKDIYELGRTIPKTDIYNLKVKPPKVFIPRFRRFPVKERTLYNGEILTPIDVHELRKVLSESNRDWEVGVVCFLHSYVNPHNEEVAGKVIEEYVGDVVLSSQVVRRWIEWERLTTAVLAGYVMPVVRAFVTELEGKLRAYGFRGSVVLSSCSGDVVTPQLAIHNPAVLIGSGPAMAAAYARYIATLKGFNNVIAIDMGGTSTDISLIVDSALEITNEAVIADHKNCLESVDVRSIGAGGGSIAWIDDMGILRVGPKSAGAFPGPACYGRGGDFPTVTDADLVLARLPYDYFLGGETVLSRELAFRAVKEYIADKLGVDVFTAALAISDIVESNMSEQIRLFAVEKGRDPRNFVLVGMGGAAGLHICGVAARLGIRKVYVPRMAAVGAAFGAATSDFAYVVQQFIGKQADEIKDGIDRIYNELFTSAKDKLRELGFEGINRVLLSKGAEMRYFGQLRDVTIWLPPAPNDMLGDSLADLLSKFHARHFDLYGYSDPTLPVQLNMLKLRIIGLRAKPEIQRLEMGSEPIEPARMRNVVCRKNLEPPVPCYRGEAMRPGMMVRGPCVVEEVNTTLWVPEGAVLTVDEFGNYEMVITET